MPAHLVADHTTDGCTADRSHGTLMGEQRTRHTTQNRASRGTFFLR
jgi:hypothetical protein